jgi:recombinational DNA repair ATPase RecF
MPDAPLEIIREVRQSLRAWLDQVQASPDPASQPPGELKRISELLKRVDAALKAASPDLKASEEWKQELAKYAEILRELRARLGNFEITLRIRSSQMANKRAQFDAVRSWADLAKHIG